MIFFQKLKGFAKVSNSIWSKALTAVNLVSFAFIIGVFISVLGCKAYQPEIDPELQKQANEGDSKAQYEMAKSFSETNNEFFITGQSRLENLEESAVWLEKAASQGNLQAQYHLARYYAIMKNDLDRAFIMMKSLAEQGYVEAQYVLSTHYVKGWGTPKDLALAYKWSLLAFEANHITLRNFHYYLVFSEYLTHNQISEGQKLAKEHITMFGTSKRLFEGDN